MRKLILAGAILSLGVCEPSFADTPAGYIVTRVQKPITKLETDLRAAVEKKAMAVVTRASASDGARSRGVSIRGDIVVGVFRNDFAVRMLAVNVDAGLEAPIRLHLVEEADGSSSIRYRTPTAVFAPYGSPELAALASELDVIMSDIVDAATAR